MINAAYDAYKAFEGMNKFEKRIVAFIDAMGIKARMYNSDSPQELQRYAQLMYMYSKQSFAKDKLRVVMFSDCMYIITEEQHVELLINFLINLEYAFLTNRTIMIDCTGHEVKDWNEMDCLKVRGGITYGDVIVLDDEAERRGIIMNSNAVLGPAVVRAYELESKNAIYPRIVVDESFMECIKTLGISYDDLSLVKDDDMYYLDFLSYVFARGGRDTRLIHDCLDFVEKELKTLGCDEKRLGEQLEWYRAYLGRYT